MTSSATGDQTRRRSTRRLLVPEVIQTSAMDCGPAALKALLEGYGVPISYGRLREACQTAVDGTSIDTLEDIAHQLGLDAEQVMLPVDQVLLGEAGMLPALAVVRLPNGFTHFVVLWSVHGPLVQVMDPGRGRRWVTRRDLERDLYVHAHSVPADGWRDYAGSNDFLGPLRARLRALGVNGAHLVETALADPGWKGLASLDAGVRATAAIVAGGAARRGREALALLEPLVEAGRLDLEDPVARVAKAGEDAGAIPPVYWSVRPVTAPADQKDTGELCLRGAVLVHVRGLRRTTAASAEAEDEAKRAPLSPELARALAEPPVRPLSELLRLLREEGLFAPFSVLVALSVAAGGIVLEAVLLRSLIDIGRELDVTEQRLSAFGALLVFLIALVLVELHIATSVLRFGRRIEVRLRAAFLRKIPRLGDRYFQSRPVSDMAERSHTVHTLRQLPLLGGELLRTTFALLATALGIAWLDPPSAGYAAVATALAFVLPLLLQSPLAERDLRVRIHSGALTRFYLDALLGLTAIKSHGAEESVRGEHESLVTEWVRAGRSMQRAVVLLQALVEVSAVALAGWLFLGYLARATEPSAALLLVYWALTLPVLGRELALLAREYPHHRNVTLRLLEPLGASEAPNPATHLGSPDPTEGAATISAAEQPALQPAADERGVGIELRRVTVRAAGHTILEDVDVSIAAGSHVAIVGPSGAGKSSLVGLLLGWHQAAAGTVRVRGRPLDADWLAELRSRTVWVDPAVQLWNRPLYDNLLYGRPEDAPLPLGHVLGEADLRSVVEMLPDGLQTPLGEGGGLLSGGEGQRVRLARGALRPDPALVILDEPFRGLDRDKRRLLLGRARRWWKDATLLCVTHDVGETLEFERALVIEGGRVIEDGAPRALAARESSRYRALLSSEAELRKGLWASSEWRRLRLEAGVLVGAPDAVWSSEDERRAGASA
jgi:ATP-binding cassette subfamily B protein